MLSSKKRTRGHAKAVYRNNWCPTEAAEVEELGGYPKSQEIRPVLGGALKGHSRVENRRESAIGVLSKEWVRCTS